MTSWESYIRNCTHTTCNLILTCTMQDSRQAQLQRFPKASRRLISPMHGSGQVLSGANHVAWPHVATSGMQS